MADGATAEPKKRSVVRRSVTLLAREAWIVMIAFGSTALGAIAQVSQRDLLLGRWWLAIGVLGLLVSFIRVLADAEQRSTDAELALANEVDEHRRTRSLSEEAVAKTKADAEEQLTALRDRYRPRFTLDCGWELLADRPSKSTLGGHTTMHGAFVRVTNHGPTSRFVAEVTEITGVAHLRALGRPPVIDRVPSVAWARKRESASEIGTGMSDQLMPIALTNQSTMWESGAAFSFLAANPESEPPENTAQQFGPYIAAAGSDVGFVLTVSSLDHGTYRVSDCTLHLGDPGESTFRIVPREEDSPARR